MEDRVRAMRCEATWETYVSFMAQLGKRGGVVLHVLASLFGHGQIGMTVIHDPPGHRLLAPALQPLPKDLFDLDHPHLAIGHRTSVPDASGSGGSPVLSRHARRRPRVAERGERSWKTYPLRGERS